MTNPFFLYGLAFLTAFCSISIELILCSKISQLLYEGIFTYSLCVGLFILCMGLGSFRQYKKNLKSKEEILNAFFRVEIYMTILVGISLISIDSIYSLSKITNFNALLSGVIFIIIIGFVTGQELPLLFSLVESLKIGHNVQRNMIFFDYLASFFASLVFTFFIFPYWGNLKASIFISLLNFLILLYLGRLFIQTYQNSKRKILLICTPIGLCLFVCTLLNDKIENELLERNRSYYHNDRLVAKMNTPYQQVLLFSSRIDESISTYDIEKIASSPQDYRIHLYLNGFRQFNNYLGVTNDAYHTYLMDSFIKTNPNIKKALILGGGDGLPARQLLQYDQVEKIDLVDLDEKWINFTQTNPIMRVNTQDSLNSPKIKLYYSDAFKWMNHSKKVYDLIIVDFPEGFNLATIRTVSVQFLNDLRRSLSRNGVIVIQDDFSKPPPEIIQQLLYNTGIKAKLSPLLGFKEYSNRTKDTVGQLALFKKESVKKQYLQRFYNEYIHSESEMLDKYGHIKYKLGMKPSDDGYISFYDPIILSKIFRPIILNRIHPYFKKITEYESFL